MGWETPGVALAGFGLSRWNVMYTHWPFCALLGPFFFLDGGEKGWDGERVMRYDI
jgi:hypothetical protein